MEKNTVELILEELLKTRSEMGNGFTVLNKKTDDLAERLTNVEIRLTNVEGRLNNVEERLNKVEERLTGVEKGILDIIQTVQFVGNKVFDNHERRIKAFETA